MNRPSPARLALAGSLLVVTGLTAGAVSSSAAPTNKTFTASLSGLNAAGGAASEAVVAITNTAKGPQPFASANITIPSAFSPCTATCPAPSSDYDTHGFFELALIHNGDGTTTLPVRSNVGSGVAPGATIHVHVWVTNGPVVCASTSWPVAVKQSNDFSGTGNDFIGSPAAPAPYLQFTRQPPSATEFDMDMSLSPQVSSFDGCGNPTTSSPTITLSDTAAHLSLKATPTASGNVTTFGGVQFTTFDFVDQLLASAAGYSSAKSTAFTVAQKVQPCTSSDCQPLTLNGSKTLGVITPSKPGVGQDGLVSGSALGADNTMCGESASGISDKEISATISFDSPTAKTVTFTIDKSLVNAISNNGAPFMSVCLRTTDTDGTNHDMTLPDCFKGGVTTLPPCVVSRNKNQANEVIVVNLPAGDPHSNIY